MSKRDYYEILGLERNATDSDIKRSYRKLARQYHPDVNKEDEAETIFKEVSEAYTILSDPQRRAAYDRLIHMAMTQGLTVDTCRYAFADAADAWAAQAGSPHGKIVITR